MIYEMVWNAKTDLIIGKLCESLCLPRATWVLLGDNFLKFPKCDLSDNVFFELDKDSFSDSVSRWHRSSAVLATMDFS